MASPDSFVKGTCHKRTSELRPKVDVKSLKRGIFRALQSKENRILTADVTEW